jgi:hypothetical protein
MTATTQRDERLEAVQEEADLDAIAFQIDHSAFDLATATALLTIACELRLLRRRFESVSSENHGIFTTNAGGR